MPQWVKAPASKPDNMPLILKAHMKEGENKLFKIWGKGSKYSAFVNSICITYTQQKKKSMGIHFSLKIILKVAPFYFHFYS